MTQYKEIWDVKSSFFDEFESYSISWLFFYTDCIKNYGN